MSASSPYTLGLHEIGDGCHAYLQPDGGWGWSNAGLIVGDGRSLLVDTLFDLKLTATMLEAMAPLTASAPVSSLVNTHANGDHCYGNSEVVTNWPEVEIVASTATAEEMPEVPPAMLDALNQAPGEVGDLFRSFFGEFDFGGIELTLPTRTFDDRLRLEVGGRSIELIEVGPAHTQGDVIVHVPDARTVYTGDILFIGGTPIVWAGPLSNWIAACDLMLAMDVDTVVPGHGPLTDRDGIVEVRDYLAFVDTEATGRHDAGIDAFDAAKDIAELLDASPRFGDWGEYGRIAVNVDTVYRTLDVGYTSPDVVEQFRRMAELEAR
ncbi:MBL fold metallo-hydrolase [Ilumatobacter nonamiensis]|uniref:MBL fold metallo-hydrolase n=1 Tax=Ilumatobacter nonamiensis TaxID=467093 RepID=UPI000347FBB7|nr:MBL fold metallo-hydrolase [Ilumatobacter nonamiensis]